MQGTQSERAGQMNISRLIHGIPEHLQKRPRKYLLQKSTVKPERMMKVSKLRMQIMRKSCYDIVGNTPAAYDQGDEGYCFAESSLRAYETELFKQTQRYLGGSAQFIGNMAKTLDGSFGQDTGSTLTTGFQSMKKFGICKESEFPYGSQYIGTMPSDTVKLSALNNQLLNSYSIEAGDGDSIKMANLNGYGVSFGMKLYPQFESQQANNDGIILTPHWYDFQSIGGHALFILAFDDNLTMQGITGWYLVPNSWGQEWGIKDPKYLGFCWVPQAYIHNSNLAWDFQVATQDEIGEAA